MKVVNYVTETEKTTLKATHISANDIPTLAGDTRFKTMLKLYHEKKGMGFEIEDSDMLWWNTQLKNSLVSKFMKDTGKTVTKENQVIIDDENPVFMSNAKLWVCGENAILKTKVINIFKAEEWDNGNVPMYHYLQAQWDLGITKADVYYLCCLLGTGRTMIRQILPNGEVIKAIRDLAADFWCNYVEKDIMPKAVVGDETLLSKIYPSVDMTVDISDKKDVLKKRESAYTKYEKYKEKAKEFEKIVKECDIEIKDRLQGNIYGVCGKYKVSNKITDIEGVDKDKLKSLYPDAFKNCIKTTHRANFRVSVVGAKK